MVVNISAFGFSQKENTPTARVALRCGLLVRSTLEISENKIRVVIECRVMVSKECHMYNILIVFLD